MTRDGLYQRPESRFWWCRDPVTKRRVSTGLEDHEAAKRWKADRRALVPKREKKPPKRLPAMQFAVDQVSKAVASGELKREPCEVCGNPKSYGHHDDYAKPLIVRWLCGRHHREWHAKHGEAPNARLTVTAVIFVKGGLKIRPASVTRPRSTEGAVKL